MVKKTILHLITGLKTGGAEKALLNNLPHMPEFEHIVCSLSGYGDLGDNFRRLGFQVYVLNSGKYFSPSAIYKFYKITKKHRPAALVTYLIHADLFGRIFGKIFGIKKIICYLRSELNNKKYAWAFFAEKITSNWVFKYFAVSNSVKQTYVVKAKINPDKIIVIPNGLNLNTIPNSRDQTALKELNPNQQSLILTCVARLSPEKNHLLLLEVFNSFCKSYPNSKLLLVGDGPEKNKIKEQISQYDLKEKVKLLGQRRDVLKILSITDIFLLLSSFEGMSNAILEALASGCPIVASDIEPNRELITQEKNGFLVPPKNPENILTKLLLLAKQPELRKEIKLNNQELAKKYSLDATTKMFAEKINKIIG